MAHQVEQRIIWQPDAMPDEEPREGKQSEFLNATEDWVDADGGKGSGKSDLLVFDSLYPDKVNDPRWLGVIFRREYKRLSEIIDRAKHWTSKIPQLGAHWQGQDSRFIFPRGGRLGFHNVENPGDEEKYQGWEICDLKFDQLEEFCLTPDHEVLTDSGWKNICDVLMTDMVYSIDQDRSISTYPVMGIHKFSVDKELNHYFTRSGASFLATDNHKLVIETSGIATGVRKHARKKDKGFRLCAIKDLPEDSFVLRVGNYAEGLDVESITIPASTGRGFSINQNNVIDAISGDDFIEFMGWYISEGCAYQLPDNEKGKQQGRAPRVIITQVKINESLDRLMNRLPWKMRHRVMRIKGGEYTIYSRQLFEYLKPLGNTYTKRVPRWILDASPRQLKIFFDAFVQGDGHTTPKGAIHIALANEGLIDDLSEICLKLGLIATKSFRKVYLKKYNKYYDSWRLSIHKPGKVVPSTNIKKSKIQKIKYTGEVYCLSVPPHNNFFIRYKGRTSFTGNSQPIFDYLLLQNRTGSTIKPTVRWTANPIGEGRSWLKKRFIDNKISGQTYNITQEHRGQIYTKTYKRIFMTVFDNPFLKNDVGYISTLANTRSPELRKAFLEGDWNVSVGQFFYDFMASVHVIPTRVLPKEWNRLGGLDYGNNKVLSILASDDFGNIYDEWEYASLPYLENGRMRAKTSGEFAEDSAEWMLSNGIGENLVVIGDVDLFQMKAKDIGSEKTSSQIVQAIWNKRFKKAGKKPPLLFRVVKKGNENYNYRVACNEAVKEYLRFKTDEQFNVIVPPKVFFFDRCKGIIETLPELVGNADDMMDFVQYKGDAKVDHFFDSFKMAQMQILQTKEALKSDSEEDLSDWMKQLYGHLTNKGIKNPMKPQGRYRR